jgi:hypothetical protein
MVAVATMLVSAVTVVGGSLASTAVPASAAPGGTNVCTSGVATANVLTGMATGTFSGCHQQGSATTSESFDPTNPFAPTQVTVNWATGHATSVVIAQGGPHLGTNPCPAGDVAGDVHLTVVSGPYSGSTGGYVICFDLSEFPIINSTSVGPIVI